MIHIFGHRRSGNNFLAAALRANIGPSKYLCGFAHYPAKQAVHAIKQKDPNCVVVHIWRSFDAVAKSVWSMRQRFGITAPTYKVFLRTPYNKMHKNSANGIVTCTYTSLTTGRTQDKKVRVGVVLQVYRIHPEVTGLCLLLTGLICQE